MSSLSITAPAVELRSVPRPVARSASPWIRGPLWDGFWMLNALWLAPIVFWLAHGYSDPASSPLDHLYFGLTALFWIGHRLCSTYLAYCTEAYRPLLRTQPVRFIVLPLLITVACLAVFLPADSALPWPRDQRLIALAIIDYGWVTYHFASQHFGALSLYRTRAGIFSVRTRQLDRFFSLAVGGVLVFVADALAGAVAYQDEWLDRWVIPAWMVDVQDQIRWGAAIVLIVSTGVVLLAELRTPARSLPRVLYIIGVALMVGIALQPRSLFLFLVIWNAQHWILATGLGSRVPGKEPAAEGGIFRRILHNVNIRPWALIFLFTIVSVLLMPLFEVEASRDTGIYYGDRILGRLATELRTSTWVPALLALGFATGFIHYLLDRSIYRMSDPEVRKAARGLLEGRKS